jgi:hypothetical protein
VNTALTGTSTAAGGGLPEAGGSSGVILDNISGTTGASQLYFSTLGTGACSTSGSIGVTAGGCAIQASQSSVE